MRDFGNKTSNAEKVMQNKTKKQKPQQSIKHGEILQDSEIVK